MSGARFGNGFGTRARERKDEEREAHLIFWGLPESATWADIHRMYEEQHQQNEQALKVLEERDRAELAVRGFGRR